MADETLNYGMKIVPIGSIKVPDSRQRTVFPEQEMEDLKQSILSQKGLMCPILLRPNRSAPGTYYLVAGERRLRAITGIDRNYTCGNETIPQGHVPAVVKEFSSDIEIMEAELHENVIRLDLSWQDKALAIDKLHKLKKLQDPRQTHFMTAALIDTSSSVEKKGSAAPRALERVHQSILVAAHMDNPEVAKAGSLKDATKVVSRKLEREAIEKLRASAATRAAANEAARLAAAASEAEKQSALAAAVAAKDPVALVKALAATNPEESQVIEKRQTFLETISKSNCNLLRGDCRDHLPSIPDGSVNVVITDPPYGMGVEHFNDTGDSTLGHEYSESDFHEIHIALVQNLERMCAASAHVYVFCDLDYFPTLKGMFGPTWRVRRTPLIWSKGNTGNLADGVATGYRRSYEAILYATRGRRHCAELISDVITVPMVKFNSLAAQKPPELYTTLLKMSAVPGDTILDAFAGSGTIFLAAKALPLITVIGIEKDPMFQGLCELAMQGKVPDQDKDF